MMPGLPTDTRLAAATTDSSNLNTTPIASPNTQGGDPMFWFMLRHVPVGVAFISLDGYIHQVNPELCRFLGYSEEQLCTLAYHQITHPDALLANTTLYGKLASGELDTARMETIFMRGDGIATWGLLSVALVRDSAGKPSHFMSMIQDITLRKRVQAELEWTRNRYGAILDSLEDVVFVTGPDHKLLYVNHACRRLLGWKNEEFVGSYLYNYIHADDQQAVKDSFALLAIATGEHPHVNCRLARKDGTWLWLDTYARIVRDPSGGIVEIIRVGRAPQKQERMSGFLPSLAEPAASPALPALSAEATDTLTGLCTRKVCDNLLTIRLASPRSSAFPVGCLLVDIDHFSAINATYGRGVGDEVLKRLTAILNESCRDEDFVARYGPDEFLVVLPGTSAAGTIILGEKLVNNIRETDWSDLKLQAPVTVSVGATCVHQGSGLGLPELEVILQAQVDQARQSGRDRMVMDTRRIANSDKPLQSTGVLP